MDTEAIAAAAEHKNMDTEAIAAAEAAAGAAASFIIPRFIVSC